MVLDLLLGELRQQIWEEYHALFQGDSEGSLGVLQLPILKNSDLVDRLSLQGVSWNGEHLSFFLCGEPCNQFPVCLLVLRTAL